MRFFSLSGMRSSFAKASGMSTSSVVSACQKHPSSMHSCIWETGFDSLGTRTIFHNIIFPFIWYHMNGNISIKYLAPFVLHRLRYCGSPALWATWLDESLNANFGDIAAAAHALVWSQRVLSEWRHFYGDLKRSTRSQHPMG